MNNPGIDLSLLEEFKKVIDAYESHSTFLSIKSVVKDWSKDDIKLWSITAKPNKIKPISNNDLLELQIHITTKAMLQPMELLENLTILSEKPSIYEIIAVLMRAFKIFKGYEPREIQILSLLLLLNPKQGKGRLTQINTGEK